MQHLREQLAQSGWFAEHQSSNPPERRRASA
jgi:hypothetical protein